MKNSWFIVLMLFCAEVGAQSYAMDTLLWNGPADKRINIVMLGDGYQESELNKFVDDARLFSIALFKSSPYKEYESYFNIIAIRVPSIESGASHPGTATDVSEPAHPVSTVNNFFGSTFDAYNIHRLLVVGKSSAVYTVVANQFPSYDQIIMLVNSPYYGGSGGAIATSSLHSSANEIAIHELGHSFARLKDEYYAGDVYSAEAINMTQETNATLVRWKNWMNFQGVGIYQHCCGGNSSKWYRPHQNCRMKALNQNFCPICIEGTIERIHDLVPPIDDYVPTNTATINFTEAQQFSLGLVKPLPNTLDVKWELNGNLFASKVDTILVHEEEWKEGNNTLVATVIDTTAMLRSERHSLLHFFTVLWTINKTSTATQNVSSQKYEIEVYPNPVQSQMNVRLNSEIDEVVDIHLYRTLGGNAVYGAKGHSNETITFQTASLTPGVYWLEMVLPNKATIVKKVIKE
ncbi:MAG: T9SS type A sorting domain-containing protein [Saprospiraceae bacterium]|nr:T9SS type A sorting domain-containing protein [Saprospiraceae bacterium]